MISSIGSASDDQNVDMNLKVDIDNNIPTGKLKNKYGIALLIGNQDYTKGLPDVKYAKRDVAVMKQYIVKTLGYMPGNIIARTNVTSGGFRTLFGNGHNSKGKLHDYIRQGKSDVFIYYVGHGGPGPEGKTNYLVPVDAEADYIQNNGYPLNDFYSVVKNLGAKNVTIVLDACFSGDSASGSLFKNISPAMLKTTNPIQNIEKAAIFCAADKDQVATWYPSKRHSLFSYYFLKGLSGAADKNKDKIIRLDEMKAYLASEVKYQAGRESGRVQTPLVTGDDNIIIAELK
ncbi:MAG: caspase family protein [Desulfobacterales bacterium]|nr:caspase family protein [Desulfobacterales bacterium]